MKKKSIILLILGVLILPVTSTAQIKTSTFREKANLEIIREVVVDKNSEPYVREREVIIRQLRIITGDEETRYIIVPGDTLDISFKDRSEDNEGVYQVSSEGEIHMPLIGAAKVAGINRKQVREKLNAYYSEYIRHPKVQVQVNVSGRYMVAGEVASPGVYRIRSNLTVMEAILAADFDRDKVNLKSIMVMRGSYDKPIAKRLNLLKMIKKGDRTDNIFVKPGDFIYVPKRFIANVEKFIDNVYRYVSAYYGLGRIPGEPADTGAEPDHIFFE